MEGYSHLGSMIVIDEKVNHALLDRLNQTLPDHLNDYQIGISLLPIPGFTIRVLANKTQTIERIFSEFHTFLSQEWFEKRPCFLRKY